MSRSRIPRLVVLIAAATLVAAACSSADDEKAESPGTSDRASTQVVASLGDTEITEEEIAELIADPAYRSYAQIDCEPPAPDELPGSEAGAIALSLLLQDRAIEDELERRDLEVLDADLDAARETLVREDPGAGATVKTQPPPFTEPVGEQLAQSIANHVVLDKALRQSNPDDADQQADVLEQAPSIAEKFCGPGVVVDAAQNKRCGTRSRRAPRSTTSMTRASRSAPRRTDQAAVASWWRSPPTSSSTCLTASRRGRSPSAPGGRPPASRSCTPPSSSPAR